MQDFFPKQTTKNVQEHSEVSPSTEGRQVSLDKSGQRANMFKDWVDLFQKR